MGSEILLCIPRRSNIYQEYLPIHGSMTRSPLNVYRYLQKWSQVQSKMLHHYITKRNTASKLILNSEFLNSN